MQVLCNITYGLFIFMSFAVPTVPERFNDWLDKPFDFHISILELLLPELFLRFSTSKCLLLFLVTLSLIFFNLVSKSIFILPSISLTLVLKSIFLTKILILGILFSTTVKTDFVAKLLISGILFSTTVKADFVAKLLISGILLSISVTLVLKSVFLTKLVTSGIFLSILSILFSKSDPSFSCLVLETKSVLSIPFTSNLATNLSYSVFLITSFLTTLLNLAKSTGTVFNLPASILSTSVFKLA